MLTAVLIDQQGFARSNDWDGYVNRIPASSLPQLGSTVLHTFPNAETTLISRVPGLQDAFAVDASGGVYSNWKNSAVDGGAWHAWLPIGAPANTAPPGAHVAAVSRLPNKLDLFVVDNNGGVYSNWWSSDADSGQWHAWFRIGGVTDFFPAGAPVSAVARGSSHLNLFVAGYDGVYTNWWDANVDGAVWHAWTRIGPATAFIPPGASIAAVSRRPDQLDIFAVDVTGQLRNTWWNIASPGYLWSASFGIGPAQAALPGAPVSVVSRTGDRLDVFVAGRSGAVMTASWERTAAQGPAGGPWSALAAVGDPTVGTTIPTAFIGAVAIDAGTMAIAAVMNDGVLRQSNYTTGASVRGKPSPGRGSNRPGTPVDFLTTGPGTLVAQWPTSRRWFARPEHHRGASSARRISWARLRASCAPASSPAVLSDCGNPFEQLDVSPYPIALSQQAKHMIREQALRASSRSTRRIDRAPPWPPPPPAEPRVPSACRRSTWPRRERADEDTVEIWTK